MCFHHQNESTKAHQAWLVARDLSLKKLSEQQAEPSNPVSPCAACLYAPFSPTCCDGCEGN